jgi:flagella basal body P-ring formation protein FlgA
MPALSFLRAVSPALVLAFCVSVPLAARADAVRPDQNVTNAIAEIERSLKSFVESETQRLPGRVEIAFGRLDARMQLAPCQRIEPYVPSGARLWGRSSIGLRCRDGISRWNVYLPVEVRVFVPALVAVRAVPAGQPLGAEDVQTEEVDITREPAGLLTHPNQLDRRITARAIAAGAPLRQDMLRARPVIAQGDQVKVVYLGAGFVVAAEGKALTAAGDGQTVRVQVDSGRVVSGTAREGRQVEMR